MPAKGPMLPGTTQVSCCHFQAMFTQVYEKAAGLLCLAVKTSSMTIHF